MSETFEVTIHGALRGSFEMWCRAHHMSMIPFGPNDAGTQTYALGITPDSPTAQRFEATK